MTIIVGPWRPLEGPALSEQGDRPTPVFRLIGLNVISLKWILFSPRLLKVPQRLVGLRSADAAAGGCSSRCGLKRDGGALLFRWFRLKTDR